jgi:hypothetical protein
MTEGIYDITTGKTVTTDAMQTLIDTINSITGTFTE